MSSSQNSPNNCSPGSHNGQYANIVATVALGLGLFVGGLLYGKLEQFDLRLRTLEQGMTALLTIHNIDPASISRPVVRLPGSSAGLGSASPP